MIDDHRPDPDALLERVRDDEARAARGKLRIYFGSSAGVGKTYAMLAPRAARASGEARDVVVGVVETPRPRRDRGAAAKGSRCCRCASHRDRGARHARPSSTSTPRWRAPPGADPGRRAGALQRRRLAPPQALAGRRGAARRRHRRLDHAQRPASGEPQRRRRRHHRHPRPGDPARHLLRPRRRGRAGRHAGRRAARAAEGRQGLPAAAGRARRANFFRKGNLMALRELALRRTADRVEDDVQAYRVDRSIGRVWKTEAAMLCCVGPGEGGEHIVRSAALLAQQLAVSWHAVYVETPALQRLRQRRGASASCAPSSWPRSSARRPRCCRARASPRPSSPTRASTTCRRS